MTAPPGGTAPSWTPGPADWVVEVAATPPPPPRRQGRRRLLVGAAVLVLAAIAAGVATWRALDTGPGSPQEAVELFFAADGREDWSASWDLVCESERQAVGSLERWIHLKETAIATSDSYAPGLTVVAGRAHPMPDTAPQAYMVEYYLPEDSGMYPLRVVVVAEDGGFAVCTIPESES